MKKALKRMAQSVAAIGAPVLWRLRAPSLLILMYHRVLPVGHPDRKDEQAGMYVSPETLRMHLDVLKRHFTIMHLDDWIELAASGEGLPRLSCALTFDDGWLDNYQYAYPVLRDVGVPATIYLVADLVGTSYEFWPNRLAKILRSADHHRIRESDQLAEVIRIAVGDRAETGTPMGSADIDAVIATCKRLHTDAQLESMLDALSLGSGSEQRNLMNWNEVRELHASRLVRFGSHSRRHTRLLDNLNRNLLEDEIVQSAEIIQRETGKAPVTFCYPNGDHCAAAVDLVRRSYRAATTTQRGWNSSRPDLHLLKRVGVHDDVSADPASFLARLGGVG